MMIRTPAPKKGGRLPNDENKPGVQEAKGVVTKPAAAASSEPVAPFVARQKLARTPVAKPADIPLSPKPQSNKPVDQSPQQPSAEPPQKQQSARPPARKVPVESPMKPPVPQKQPVESPARTLSGSVASPFKRTRELPRTPVNRAAPPMPTNVSYSPVVPAVVSFPARNIVQHHRKSLAPAPKPVVSAPAPLNLSGTAPKVDTGLHKKASKSATAQPSAPAPVPAVEADSAPSDAPTVPEQAVAAAPMPSEPAPVAPEPEVDTVVDAAPAAPTETAQEAAVAEPVAQAPAPAPAAPVPAPAPVAEIVSPRKAAAPVPSRTPRKPAVTPRKTSATPRKEAAAAPTPRKAAAVTPRKVAAAPAAQPTEAQRRVIPALVQKQQQQPLQASQRPRANVHPVRDTSARLSPHAVRTPFADRSLAENIDVAEAKLHKIGATIKQASQSQSEIAPQLDALQAKIVPAAKSVAAPAPKPASTSTVNNKTVAPDIAALNATMTQEQTDLRTRLAALQQQLNSMKLSTAAVVEEASPAVTTVAPAATAAAPESSAAERRKSARRRKSSVTFALPDSPEAPATQPITAMDAPDMSTAAPVVDIRRPESAARPAPSLAVAEVVVPVTAPQEDYDDMMVAHEDSFVPEESLPSPSPVRPRSATARQPKKAWVPAGARSPSTSPIAAPRQRSRPAARAPLPRKKAVEVVDERERARDIAEADRVTLDDIPHLDRADLQALCKTYGLPANTKTGVMIATLSELFSMFANPTPQSPSVVKSLIAANKRAQAQGPVDSLLALEVEV